MRILQPAVETERRKEKKMKREEMKEKAAGKKIPIDGKYIIVFLFAIVLGLSSFHFLQYETEKADRLIKAAAREINNGSELLHTVETDLRSEREIQFTAVDNFNLEREYAGQCAETVHTLLPLLDEASAYFEHAEEFLEKAKTLKLPHHYHQYINLETTLLKTYTEYDEALRTLCTNYLLYYQFADHFLTGEQLLLELTDDMDRGNDNLESGTYQFAAAAYESALQQLKNAQKAYEHASKILDLPYMDDLLSNIVHMERALYNLSEAARQLELGNVDQANLLAALGSEEIESVTTVTKLQLKIQATQWYAEHITALIEDIDEVKSEIEELKTETELRE
ncbi:MAG: hypothetical protein HXS46_08235 [Theionarchaea archaeon]|nr:hypothetical protein [Theionarchaea archaeon]